METKEEYHAQESTDARIKRLWHLWGLLQMQIEHLQEDLAATEAEMSEIVFRAGETIVREGVRATFNHGRKCYDYETAVKRSDIPPLALWLYAKTTYDYRGLCRDRCIFHIPYTEGKPYVSVKLER